MVMGGPSIKPPPAPPQPVDAFDTSVRDAGLTARRKQLAMQGRMSMFLTGPKGVAPAASTSKSLLGG
jgi:hypothetical protein